MRWWGGERWSDEFLKTRWESGGSGTPASPKPSRRSGGAPWWAWVVAMIVAVGVMLLFAGLITFEWVVRKFANLS